MSKHSGHGVTAPAQGFKGEAPNSGVAPLGPTGVAPVATGVPVVPEGAVTAAPMNNEGHAVSLGANQKPTGFENII